MVWYYRDSDQEIGPVSKAELQNLVKSKQVSAQTLVRSVEMTEWVPLIDVVRGKAGKTPPPPPLNTAAAEPQAPQTEPDDGIEELTMESASGTALEEAANHDLAIAETGEAVELAICSQCGGTFPEDQVIAIEDRMICAACKPTFVQKLKEGVATPLSVAYGGFWIRVLAYLIDTIILGVAMQFLMIPISAVLVPSLVRFQPGNEAAVIGSMFMLMGVYTFISILLLLFYYTFLHGRWGATLGKMACGLRVVTAEGGRITYMRAFGRYWAFLLSGFILCIGHIMAAFDDEKRTLHDRICSTRVIKKR